MGFHKMHSIEIRFVTETRKYCSQVCACTLHPERFTGWGLEVVKCAAKANWFAGGDTPFSLCGYCP